MTNLTTLNNYIDKRKKEIQKLLELDHEIKADPYENIARLKEVLAIEKIIRKGGEKEK